MVARGVRERFLSTLINLDTQLSTKFIHNGAHHYQIQGKEIKNQSFHLSYCRCTIHWQVLYLLFIRFAKSQNSPFITALAEKVILLSPKLLP